MGDEATNEGLTASASAAQLAQAMRIQLLSVSASCFTFILYDVLLLFFFFANMSDELPVTSIVALSACTFFDSACNDFCAHWLACTVEDSQFDEARAVAVARRERLIRAKLWDAARSTTGPAVMLAALFEGQEPEILFAQAVARFRSILWAVLRNIPEIIVGGGPLDVV